jgi:hypothetical protein
MACVTFLFSHGRADGVQPQLRQSEPNACITPTRGAAVLGFRRPRRCLSGLAGSTPAHANFATSQGAGSLPGNREALP